MKRKQFPIRLSYAITANKSQGQTSDKVGIYLNRPCISHGQLYVALSRCGDRKCIKVLRRKGNKSDEALIRNVVYRAVFKSESWYWGADLSHSNTGKK